MKRGRGMASLIIRLLQTRKFWIGTDKESRLNSPGKGYGGILFFFTPILINVVIGIPTLRFFWQPIIGKIRGRRRGEYKIQHCDGIYRTRISIPVPVGDNSVPLHPVAPPGPPLVANNDNICCFSSRRWKKSAIPANDWHNKAIVIPVCTLKWVLHVHMAFHRFPSESTIIAANFP